MPTQDSAGTWNRIRLSLLLLLLGFSCYMSGLFDQPTPVSLESYQPTTLAYLQYQGPFMDIPDILQNVSRLLNRKHGKMVGMFFDNPDDSQGFGIMRWGAGVIINENQTQEAIHFGLHVV